MGGLTGGLSGDGVSGIAQPGVSPTAIGTGGGPGGGSTGGADVGISPEERAWRRSLIFGTRLRGPAAVRAGGFGISRLGVRPAPSRASVAASAARVKVTGEPSTAPQGTGRFERTIERALPGRQSGLTIPTLAGTRAPPGLVRAAERALYQAEQAAAAFFRGGELAAGLTPLEVELTEEAVRGIRGRRAARRLTGTPFLGPSAGYARIQAERQTAAREAQIRARIEAKRESRRKIFRAIAAQVPSLSTKVRRSGSEGIL